MQWASCVYFDMSENAQLLPNLLKDILEAVDTRLAEKASELALKTYETGSKEHGDAMRTMIYYAVTNSVYVFTGCTCLIRVSLTSTCAGAAVERREPS